MEEFLNVKYLNKEYKINKIKLIQLLNILDKNQKEYKHNSDLYKAIRYYNMLDEVFLKNINRL